MKGPKATDAPVRYGNKPRHRTRMPEIHYFGDHGPMGALQRPFCVLDTIGGGDGITNDPNLQDLVNKMNELFALIARATIIVIDERTITADPSTTARGFSDKTCRFELVEGAPEARGHIRIQHPTLTCFTYCDNYGDDDAVEFSMG